MSTRALQLRWSWRDLRHRWVQVVVIATILALGTGVFAALGSTATWRRASNDASFAATGFHDLKVRLSTGTTAGAGRLGTLAAGIPSAAAVEAAEERMVWPTQYDVRTSEGDVLVSGELVGAAPGATVDQTFVKEGRAPGAGEPDAGVLETNFARARDLPASGTVRVAGDVEVPYSGLGLSPEYFYLVPQAGQVFDQGSNATLFLPLAGVQELAGQPGRVNDLVLRLAPGTDGAAVRTELEAALAAAGLSASVTTRDDEPAYHVLYQDIEGDQQVWNLISFLILAGASFAAFNLISRIVEAQRREIGIGMALGVPRRQLAVRPLLVGMQVALLGVVGGLVIGSLVGQALTGMFDSVLPLPVWQTPFQPGQYALAAVIGLGLPFLATVVPVWRAVRVEPVNAIRTGHGANLRRGWAALASRLPWPRRSLAQYPVRNLLRTPRRTALTALAVGAAITVLVGVLGLLDTFTRTLSVGDEELARTAPNRLSVQLATFEPVDGPSVTALRASPEVAEVSPGLLVPAEVRRGDGTPIDVAVEVIDVDGAPWAPEAASGQAPSATTGILLAEKAADDLGVAPGDTVVLRHPRREGLGYRMVDTEVRVAGTHRLPMRPFAYLDDAQASLFGLEGLTNHAQVVPTGSPLATQRALFGLAGVASAVPVGDAREAWDEALASFSGVLRIMELAVLALALLIAFNASSISIDERARESATMFAYGVRRRTVLGMTMVESAVIGLLGTVIGVVAGIGVLQWMVGSTLAATVPEIGLQVYLAPGTLLLVVVLGVAFVGLAPVLNVRRLRRMDIPATLRVVE